MHKLISLVTLLFVATLAGCTSTGEGEQVGPESPAVGDASSSVEEVPIEVEVLEDLLEETGETLAAFDFANNVSFEFIQGDCWRPSECWSRWFMTYSGNEEVELDPTNFEGELVSPSHTAKIDFVAIVDLQEQNFAQDRYFLVGKTYQLVVQGKTSVGNEYSTVRLSHMEIPLQVAMGCFVAERQVDPAPSC